MCTIYVPIFNSFRSLMRFLASKAYVALFIGVPRKFHYLFRRWRWNRSHAVCRQRLHETRRLFATHSKGPRRFQSVGGTDNLQMASSSTFRHSKKWCDIHVHWYQCFVRLSYLFRFIYCGIWTVFLLVFTDYSLKTSYWPLIDFAFLE